MNCSATSHRVCSRWRRHNGSSCGRARRPKEAVNTGFFLPFFPCLFFIMPPFFTHARGDTSGSSCGRARRPKEAVAVCEGRQWQAILPVSLLSFNYGVCNSDVYVSMYIYVFFCVYVTLMCVYVCVCVCVRLCIMQWDWQFLRCLAVSSGRGRSSCCGASAQVQGR